MNKTLLVAVSVLGAALTGCATNAINDSSSFQARDLSSKIQSGKLVQKTNTFFVINDSSSSMSNVFEGTGFSAGATKFSVSKTLLSRMNQTIPNISLSSGLRSFGFGPCIAWGGYSHLNQAVQNYSQSSFASAIDSMECSSGGTPVASAFRSTHADLNAASGNIALILFSDGHNYDTSPIPALKAMKEEFGDKLCVYTVWVGNEVDKPGLHVLHQLSNVGQCGFSTSSDVIASNDGMARFVEYVFFNKERPTPVLEKDSDGDGVVDSKDKCPNTPKGAIVNKNGCWAFSGVFFDTDSTKIKSKYSPLFSNAVKVMGLNPSLTVEIQGHTDSIGAASYNQNLSERRAAAVKKELVNQGVDGSRLTTVGFGETKPIASNHTKEGRAQNRRVVYKRTDM